MAAHFLSQFNNYYWSQVLLTSAVHKSNPISDNVYDNKKEAENIFFNFIKAMYNLIFAMFSCSFLCDR